MAPLCGSRSPYMKHGCKNAALRLSQSLIQNLYYKRKLLKGKTTQFGSKQLVSEKFRSKSEVFILFLENT